jgi:DNA-binding LacI/PurR family transcriptional regulator
VKAAVAELKKLGLQPFRILEGDHKPESGTQAARELLGARTAGQPSALICGNDRMAIGALSAAEELGFRVPEDISIVGADDVWMTRYCNPPLTTIRIPRDVLCVMAFQVLMKMLRSKKKTGSEHVLQTKLIVRRSTCEVKHRGAPRRLAKGRLINTRMNAG